MVISTQLFQCLASEKLQMDIQQLVMDDGTAVEDEEVLKHLPSATSLYAVKQGDTFQAEPTMFSNGSDWPSSKCYTNYSKHQYWQYVCFHSHATSYF